MIVTSTLVFRQCVDGEILVDNQCLVCPSGSYSFHFDSDPLHPTTQCSDCPLFTDGCYGTTILASPGYWRIHKYSVVMIKCPYGRAACHGGGIGVPLVSQASVAAKEIFSLLSIISRNDSAPSPTSAESVDTTGDSPEGCARGYEGPLCAVCSENYYFASTTSTCIACEGNGQGQLAAMILIPLVILVLMVYFTFSTFLAKPVSDSEIASSMVGTKPMGAFIEGHVVEMAAVTFKAVANQQKNQVDNADDKNDGIWERKKNMNEIVKEQLARVVVVMTPKLKIMLTVFQIVSSLSFTLDIQYTATSTKVFHAFR